MRTELRILIVEDVAAEAEIAAYHLKAAGLQCTLRRVEREHEFREALTRWHPNVVLSDFTLPAVRRHGGARDRRGTRA